VSANPNMSPTPKKGQAQPMNEQEHKIRIRRALLRAAVGGIVCALALIVFDAAEFLSRSAVFEKIELDMSETQAWEILRSNEITCPDASSTYRCTFDDYWR